MAASSEALVEARLGACAQAVETTLEALLAPLPLPGEIARPAQLLEAMRYAALGGGKRLRPFLVVESARLFGGEGDGILRAGAALEMVHCYSLVHDDLPAMDDDDLRRGRPTLHRHMDEAAAILAGDALLTYAFDVMADPATHTDPGVRAELVLGLARAAGLGGMAGGQMLDLEAEGRYAGGAPLALDVAAVTRLQAMKTGALLAFGAEAGAIAGGATPQDRASLRTYGKALGAAFQVADDILDVEATLNPSARPRARMPAGARPRWWVSWASTPPRPSGTGWRTPRWRRWTVLVRRPTYCAPPPALRRSAAPEALDQRAQSRPAP